MADATIFAAARASLRETFKWFGASIAAFATLAASGLSWSILPEIEASRLGEAYIYCAVLLAAVLAALFAMRHVLNVRPFPRSKWIKDTKFDSDLNNYHEIFDTKFNSMPAFRAAYNAGNADAADLATKVTDFVALLDLERKTRWIAIVLVILFLAGCFAVFSLVSLKVATSQGVAVHFLPGEGWGRVSATLSDRCGADPLPAQGLENSPFEGWWTLTATGERCKGLKISIPGQGFVQVAPK